MSSKKRSDDGGSQDGNSRQDSGRNLPIVDGKVILSSRDFAWECRAMLREFPDGKANKWELHDVVVYQLTQRYPDGWRMGDDVELGSVLRAFPLIGLRYRGRTETVELRRSLL